MAIVWRTERASHRMIDKGGARWGDSAHDIVCGADDQGDNAAGFDHVSDETYGLMTEGSVGNKQRKVDLSASQLFSERRCQFVFDSPVIADSAHERIMRRRKTADDSLLN